MSPPSLVPVFVDKGLVYLQVLCFGQAVSSHEPEPLRYLEDVGINRHTIRFVKTKQSNAVRDFVADPHELYKLVPAFSQA